MPFVERGTYRLHYEITGPEGAPPLLLVMGMAFSSRAWDTLPASLADRFRVMVFDNRGTGRSTRPRDFFRMGDLADDAAAVLDAAGVGRAYVFGVSLGGMIAMELALRHPERVEALALGATFAGYLKSAKPAWRVTRGLFLSAVLGRSSAEHVAPFLVSDACWAGEKERFASWLAGVERGPPGTVLRQMAAAARHAAEGRLARLGVRTLVITGGGDRLIPPANSAALAKMIPGAELVEIDGAGHCFPFERLDETKGALVRFFLEGARGPHPPAPSP
ncbi:MAG TPA: alpha/beta hydrolase [Polyangiaceae bacterium]|nr:alpha/beta hydrolase [Polyangiaceae bacterium]